MKVTIKWRRVPVVKCVPPISVYAVTVETDKAVWDESLPTERELEAFVRGVKAGASMQGVFDIEVFEVMSDGREEPR